MLPAADHGSATVSALLVIDAQMCLLDGPTAVPSAAETTARIAGLLAAARSAGALVIAIALMGFAERAYVPVD